MKNIYICTTIILFSFFAKAQNVGIGESNPLHKLDINGDLRVQGNVVRGASSGSFNIISNGGFRIDLDDDNNDSESFRIANGSNTIVFEVTEGGNVEADGNAEFNGNVTLSGNSRTLSSGDALDISSTSGLDIIIDSDASGTGSEFYIKRDGVSGANLFRVDEDGDATIYRKLRITPLVSAPTGTKGDVYFDNGTNKLYYHDGTAWREVVNTNNISAAIATLSQASGGGLNTFSYNGGSAVQIGIANSGVDNGKIANDAVTSSKIENGTITADDLGTNSVDLASGDVTGVNPVSKGGTGVNTVTGILQGNGTSAFTGLTATAGNQYLRRNSGNTAFEFGQIDYSHLANQLTAGTGISISSGTVTNTGVITASNGLNVVSNDVRLGGSLTGATTITQDGAGEVFTIANNSADNTIVNLQSTGDFEVQDNGTTMFRVTDAGRVDIGATSATNNDLFISNRVVDWDDNSYFLDPGSDSRLNEIHADLGSVSDVSYTFGGDDNTGMWSAGADILSFSTAGAERLRIGSTGNVGIGTTTPTNTLNVNNAGTTASSTTSYPLGIQRSGSTDLTLGSDASNAYIQSWNSKPLFLNNQGNIVATTGSTFEARQGLRTRKTYNFYSNNRTRNVGPGAQTESLGQHDFCALAGASYRHSDDLGDDVDQQCNVWPHNSSSVGQSVYGDYNDGSETNFTGNTLAYNDKPWWFLYTENYDQGGNTPEGVTCKAICINFD